MNPNVTTILLECLNENILLEERSYSNYIFEATVGTGGTSGTAGPTGKKSGGSGSGTTGSTSGLFTPDQLNTIMGASSDVLNTLGLVGSVSVGSYMAKFLNNLGATYMPYGGNWLTRNIMNILPTQEALRKEGLGYTKGWAKLADTN